MAEIVLSAFLEPLFAKLGTVALEHMGRHKRIREQLQKMEGWLRQIQAVLFDAGQRAITEEFVQKWLYDLQDLAYDIDDLLDDLATDSMHRDMVEASRVNKSKVRNLIPTCCTDFGFSIGTKMNHKLNNIITKLQNLESQKNTLGLIVEVGKVKNMTRDRRLEATSLPVDEASIVGRQGDNERLLEMLLGDEPYNDEKFSIIPIVGIGGIGKTTLARFLYNQTQVNELFELKAWVCVSDEFDVFKVSKIIFQSVTGESKEFANLNLLQVAIREKLTDKRFLLVLDDVWSESYDEWETLVRPFLVGDPRSKIIITTRKQQLLKKLGYDRPYLLQRLSYDDALSLFSQHALGVNNFDLHPTLLPLGGAIVKKCDGLPLALVALGRLLRTKVDEKEWEELLNSEIWMLREENEIIPALKLSYLDLHARLKRLFAYCSLFPKDYMFDKKELILLWMAEGFLPESATSKSMERLGHEYFNELLSRSFFMHAPNDESLFVMHDMINDLATFVAEDFFLRLDNEMAFDVRKNAMGKCRHMSFVRHKYEVYGKFKVLESAKCLRTFLALSVGEKDNWSTFYLSNKILVDLLPEFPLLRVLSLSKYEISEVPESIGRLRHLRYLNLSQTRITYLPESIGDLYNLQTLLVYACRRLTKLPNNFSKLKHLRHLDVSETPLLGKLPEGIGELKSIQTLTNVIIDEANGFRVTELKDLKDLHGRISINGLDKVKNTMDVKNANLLDKEFNELEVKWSNLFDVSRNEALEKEVLNMLKPRNDRLRKLEIVSYGGIEFPSWVVDPSFIQLTHVIIRGCKKCTFLPPFGQLPSLKELFIGGMDNVKDVHSGLLGTSLEILSFVDMRELRLWSTENDDLGTTLFPRLRKLSIQDCPFLVEASLGTLPSLQELYISGCQGVLLRSVVRAGASTVTKLKIKNIFGLTQLQGGIMEYLCAVVDLDIWECHEMKYLWESDSHACNSLVNLRTLVIWSCNNLTSLGEKDKDDHGSNVNLTSLRTLRIYFCDNLERCRCPINIELISICCFSNIRVSLPSGGEKLNSLTMTGNKNLLEEDSREEEHNKMIIYKNLSSIELIEIRYWSNLKSFPDLSRFSRRLTFLSVSNCKNMESFPDNDLPTLGALKELTISNCPSMNDSFPRGLWPPNLVNLWVGGFKKTISKWDHQNFPPSLTSLTLVGGSSDDHVSSSAHFSHLFPPSLTFLGVTEFKKLESLSTGLEHLTSLRHLHISKCPKLRDLPKTLLPLLLELNIRNCPKLKESCSRNGLYWNHISHIPCIEIDEEF